MLLLLPLAGESEPEGIAQAFIDEQSRAALQYIGSRESCALQAGSLQMLTIKLVAVVDERLYRVRVEQTLDAHKVCGIHPFVLRHTPLRHNACVKAWIVLVQWKR